MSGKLRAALEQLGPEEAFRLLYGSYTYLAGLGEDTGSATQSLLRRLRRNEPEAVLLCWRKMLEENDEVRQAVDSRDAGETARASLLGELQQLLYWPVVVAAARGVSFERVGFTAFLTAGLEGRQPGKLAFDDGGSEEAVLRRALVATGRALAAFNALHPQLRPAGPREVALADLRQMADKPYLARYLREKLGVEE